MATMPTRGDCWIVDLGMVAKVRACLILSIPADYDNDRVLMTIIPHTTSTRGSRFEVPTDVRFLKDGAFDAQQIVSVPNVKLVKRIGSLPAEQLANVEAAVSRWLGLT
ncbi:MAG: type II toxin-antitoxin system PemK/MazF family toxin [Pirellulaceae bacterium]|nr:type II toxin-antitoxin system PemK/MazF family toxin [Pirellulaceae bacterium]